MIDNIWSPFEASKLWRKPCDGKGLNFARFSLRPLSIPLIKNIGLPRSCCLLTRERIPDRLLRASVFLTISYFPQVFLQGAHCCTASVYLAEIYWDDRRDVALRARLESEMIGESTGRHVPKELISAGALRPLGSALDTLHSWWAIIALLNERSWCTPHYVELWVHTALDLPGSWCTKRLMCSWLADFLTYGFLNGSLNPWLIEFLWSTKLLID